MSLHFFRSKIDCDSSEGLKFSKLKGNMVFENVSFNYPARPDVPVLQGLNLKIESGKTVALVGPSGCGKSTCIQLIQRFYDPAYGTLKVDGINIQGGFILCIF